MTLCPHSMTFSATNPHPYSLSIRKASGDCKGFFSPSLPFFLEFSGKSRPSPNFLKQVFDFCSRFHKTIKTARHNILCRAVNFPRFRSKY